MFFSIPLIGLFGLCEVVNASPVGHERVTRRQEVVPVPSSTTSGGSDGNGGQPVPMAAVIAISVVLGSGVLVLLLMQIRQWRRRRQGRDNRPTQDAALQSLTAEDLAGTRRRNRSTGGPGAGDGGAGEAQRNQRGRRSRRGRVRRTESGRSIKTLPEYSKEAGDEELVLVRRRSGSMSDDEYERPEDVEARGEREMTGTSSLPITIRSASPSPSRSRSPPSITVRDQGREATIERTIGPVPAAHATGSSSTMETLHGRGWGEAPTYLEAMSAIDPDAPQRPTTQIPAPRSSALQRTASGFKELLTRPFGPGAFRSPNAGGESGQSTPASGSRSRAGSTSALLHPTMSRFSTATSATGGDYPSPWASTHSLLISPPVPNSALRASFDGTSIPKSGLTKEQMRFLSSNEAVNLVGIRMDEVPAHKRRRRSDMSGHGTPGSPRRRSEEVEELPPPSWEQLDGERRRSEAYDRRNLAVPVAESAPNSSTSWNDNGEASDEQAEETRENTAEVESSETTQPQETTEGEAVGASSEPNAVSHEQTR